MITTIKLDIQSGTFRDHAVEQEATVQELAAHLHEECASALVNCNFRAVAAAVLKDEQLSFSLPVRDSYADLPEEGDDDKEAA